MTISRETAFTIAKEFLQERCELAFSVRKICDWYEIEWSRPNPYSSRAISWEQCWIVYLDGPLTGMMLKSSDIVVIEKDTGGVLYFGSADDQG